jgi:hypothetical protein|tara:strand:- start:397 stop:609 length:213 start_codon:yes stop_codon:yes gene_type:complete
MINRTNKLIGVTMNDMEKLNYLRLLRLAFSGQVKEIGYDKAHALMSMFQHWEEFAEEVVQWYDLEIDGGA